MLDENVRTGTSLEVISTINNRLEQLDETDEAHETRKEFYEQTKRKITNNIRLINDLKEAEELFSESEYIPFISNLLELAVMKFATTLETIIKDLIHAHFTDRTEDRYSKQLIDSVMHGSNGRHNSKNVDISYIKDTLNLFENSKSFHDEFITRWSSDEYNRLRDGLNSLKMNRNSVAHGDPISQISILDAIDYYNRSLNLVIKLDLILNESY